MDETPARRFGGGPDFARQINEATCASRRIHSGSDSPAFNLPAAYNWVMSTNPLQPPVSDRSPKIDRPAWQFELRRVLLVVALIAIATGVFTQEVGSVTFIALLAALGAWCFLVCWDFLKARLERASLSVSAYTLLFLAAHLTLIAVMVLALMAVIIFRS